MAGIPKPLKVGLVHHTPVPVVLDADKGKLTFKAVLVKVNSQVTEP
jgi:hypothetical protein